VGRAANCRDGSCHATHSVAWLLTSAHRGTDCHVYCRLVEVVREKSAPALTTRRAVCLQTADDMLCRALYALEGAWMHGFDPTTGNVRLDFENAPNRGLFLALFRHAQVRMGWTGGLVVVSVVLDGVWCFLPPSCSVSNIEFM
jgi:hypothetical protein